jgi:hypothetical protein
LTAAGAVPLNRAVGEVSTNIGTTLLFENDRVRVWEMALEPGEACELHTHVHDYLFVYTGESELELMPEGVEPWRQRFPDGFVQYTDVGREKSFPPHRVRNVDSVRHRQILVEFLGESRTETTQQPQTNAEALAAREAAAIESGNATLRRLAGS